MRNNNILYVDDESRSLNSFKLLFRRKYNIITAESGQNGLEILETQPIHLIITDQKMPNMTGVEFLKKVKEKWPSPKCILLTGFTDNEAIKEAINDVGIYWYVNKPFDTNQMEYLINKAIEAYRLDKEKKAVDKKLRMILKTALDGIITIDDQHNIVMINTAAEKMFGYGTGELLNKPLEILIPENVRSTYDPLINTFSESKAESKYVESIQRINGVTSKGNLFPIETAISKMEIDGRLYFNAIVRNVSERVKMEQKLRASEEKFKEIYNSFPDIFLRINNEGIVEMVTPSVLNILGYKQEELIGKKMTKFYDNPADRESLIKEIKEKGFCVNFETKINTKDGSLKFLSSNSIIYRDSKGNPLGIESVSRDITDKKRAESQIININRTLEQRVKKRTAELEKAKRDLEQRAKELDEASMYKSQFLANMSHEIRTPMNAIMGFSDLLSRQVTEESHKSYLEAINSSGKSLLTLINDILDLSKIEAGKMDVNYEFTDFRSLIGELERVFSSKVQKKGIKLVIEIDDNLPDALKLDEVRLRQVLFNLVGNAVKFTDAGHVKLEAKREGFKNNRANLLISVIDTGIGMSKKFQKEIFESFTQQQGQSQRKYGGTGLGLSITKKLMGLMGGEISFTSQEKKGTTFHIVLPNLEFGDNISIIEDNIDRSDTIEFENATMVIADDNQENREYICNIFDSRNIKVYDVENGKQLIKTAKKVIPDIILTDLIMPELDGFGVLGLLRNDPVLKHIPVLAITASVMPENLKKVKEHGFDGVLLKPVSINSICEELIKFLPYKLLGTETNKQAEQSKPVTNKVLTTILATLEGKMMETWRCFEEQQPIEDVEKFGRDLVGLGTEFTFEPIIKYGNDILEAANVFDIEKLLNRLKQYPVSVQRIRELLKSKKP